MSKINPWKGEKMTLNRVVVVVKGKNYFKSSSSISIYRSTAPFVGFCWSTQRVVISWDCYINFRIIILKLICTNSNSIKL